MLDHASQEVKEIGYQYGIASFQQLDLVDWAIVVNTAWMAENRPNPMLASAPETATAIVFVWAGV